MSHPLDELPDQGDFALLYSGIQTAFTGGRSILATKPETMFESVDFRTFQPDNRLWIGHITYEGTCQFSTYHAIKQFPFSVYTQALSPPVAVCMVSSNMTKPEYLTKISCLKTAIAAGEVYQANLTRKFYGEFVQEPDINALFRRLCVVSPAPYSALIRHGNTAILSSSLELFLRQDEGGYVQTRPIKGSAPLSQSADSLQKSIKDRAENLMIVDLMRNDLSKGCDIGSVKVDGLFEVSTYATLHHMASTISASRRLDVSAVELVGHCFPPGSMTGAPKYKAVSLCAALENAPRGIYSGAIGWFERGASELSVTIRTLIIQGKSFEFQVGGAIIHDSDPHTEWCETMTKAQGIACALGIDMERLYAL